jgi:3-hydroxybutyryl-CoA dehydrogenase
MKVAVIGAGVMGVDLTLALVAAGHKVLLKDISQDVLDFAKESMPKKLRGYKMLNPSLKDVSIENVFESIHFALTYTGMDQVNWVVENIPEDIDLKKKVYQELAPVCNSSVYYGVNTSCISITKIASFTPDPSRVIGMHFMNPVPIKSGVEAVRGYHTSEATIDAAKSFLKSMNKQMILVNDYPGFVANRLSHLFMNEAAFLVQDQVANPAAIDAIFKEGYGHNMGPLETADLIGLDTVVMSLKVLYENYQDTKFRCCPLLQKMVDAGELGRKSGKGFYVYELGGL